MRIVLDTNVVLSALLWRGTPYQLLTTLRAQSEYQLFSSPVLLEELAGVLTRASITKRLNLIKQSAPSVLADYTAAVTLIEPLSVPRVVLSDPDDDHVLACALAARAELIVSGDGDLLTLGQYHQIRILQPSAAMTSVMQRG
jgi:uncharacterized protein